MRIGAAAALLLLGSILVPASAGAAPAYRSLAVMDLRVEGATTEVMAEIVDYLTLRIRETGAVRRVMRRSERERRLRSAPAEAGEDETLQLQRAARLRVQAAVVGTLSWNRQQYALRLRLVDVPGGATLFEETAVFPSKAALLAGCDRIALRLAQALVDRSREAAAKGGSRAPPELTWGLGFGQQGVSGGSSVPGGSYLYAQGTFLVERAVGLSLRYALRLFPEAGGDQLLSAQARYQLPLGKEIFLPLEAGYLLDAGEQGPSHFLGARVALFAGGEQEFFIELLPVGVYFDLDTGQAVFTLELLSFTLLFGK